MIEREQEARRLVSEALRGDRSADWRARARRFLDFGKVCQTCSDRPAVTLRPNGHLLCQPCWDQELIEESGAFE